MVISPCPDQSLLADYLSGNVSANDLESIADHLETCAACGSTVAEMEPAADSLVLALRHPVERPEFEAEPQVNQVLARLRTLNVGEPREGTLPEHRLAPGVQFGAYRIEKLIGRGGMGVVYQAWHIELDRAVALKVLPRERLDRLEMVARFHREMKAIGRLNHPHLVIAHDAGQHDGIPYLAMELVEGLDLGQMVARLGPLPVADACELVRQAAEGLEYASREGIVHRDVKPSNLMLTSGGIVKVLDLGVARLADRPVHDEISQAGEVLGTLDYAAPEQLGDCREVDTRADVYSLGATLYKLLTGRAPHDRAETCTPVQKIAAVLHDPVPPAEHLRSEIPDRLAAVLSRMLAKNRADRFSTPGEVARALEPFTIGSDLRKLSVGWVSDPRADGSGEPSYKACMPPTESIAVDVPRVGASARRRWVMGAALAVILMAAATGVALLRPLGLAPLSRYGQGAGDEGNRDEQPQTSEVSETSEVSGTDAKPAPRARSTPSAVYPVAVLPFEDRSADLRLGPQTTDVVTAILGSRPEVYLVERAELDRLRKEHALGLSGAVAPTEAARVGQLTGAKILITGSTSQIDKTILLVAKIIGTETGRVAVASVDGSAADDLGALATKLAKRAVEVLGARAAELVPATKERPDRIAAILKQLGKAKRPSVWIRVAERHVGQPTVDPAAQTELTLVCRETGFAVIDPADGSRKQADITIEGEAFSELAGRHSDLVSVKARVEVKAVDRKSGRVIAVDRQTEVAVDLAEQVAGKSAIQQSAATIAERLLPKLTTASQP